MNRSRVILLAAWLLLGLGAVFQVVRPLTTESADLDQAAPSGLGGRSPGDEPLAYRDTGSDQADDIGSAEDYGNQPLGRQKGQTILDDPSDWEQAGVVLDTKADVATVTGSGVASMTDPQQGPVQHWFPSPTQFGGDRAFLVIDRTSSDDWVKVSLPVMPNGQEGWIPRSQVEITEIEHRALIDLSDDTITVWDGDEVLVQTRAVTGKRATPTPLGVFYVRDIIARSDPEGSFGPYILALSGFSEVMETFQGGLPALAIHGTDQPGQIGGELSNGCVRIPNSLITILANSVPLGTPVTVIA